MIDDVRFPCPVMQTDGSGKILLMNAELVRTAGLAAALPPGTLMDALLPPASRIFLQTHIWPMLMRDGQVREIYLHLRTPARVRIPVLTNAGLGTYAGVSCYTWVMFVAHERSKFEAELIKARDHAESNATSLASRDHFLASLANAGGRALAFLDLGARCRFVNQRFGELVNRKVAELDGFAWHELLDEAQRASHRNALERALSGGPTAPPAPWRAAPWTFFRYSTSRSEAGAIDGCFIVEVDEATAALHGSGGERK